MLTIFPNYAVCFKNNNFWIESSQISVNQTILENGIKLQIAAVLDDMNCDGNYSTLDIKDVNFISLGLYNSRKSFFLKLISYFEYLFNIIKTVKKSDFNYIYCPGHIGLFTTLIACLFNKPFGIYLRGEWRDSTPKPLHFLFNIIIRRARFIICTGAELTKKISRINRNAIAVAPMSPLLYFDPLIEPQKDDNFIKILFVGQLIKHKGVFELIHAFKNIIETNRTNLKLDIVGNGAEKRNLELLIQKYNLQEHISIFGINSDIEKLANLYAKGDIFCLPTYTEGFPRVIYEAMHFSLPIITTKVGQIPSLIVDGQNGVFCIPGSIDSLTVKLLELIDSKSNRLLLGYNANNTLKPFLMDWRKTSHGNQITVLLKKNNFIQS